jgi:hypothetical protein
MALSFIMQFQTALNDAGATLAVDGDWGPLTSKGATMVQLARNLPATGLPEPTLAAALNVTIPNVPPALVGVAAALAKTMVGLVDSIDALKLLLHESGLDASIENAEGYVGIFQISQAYLPNFGLTVEAFKAMPAAAQVPYAARWWDGVVKGFRASLPVSGQDLYWLNYLPASYLPGADDGYAFVKSDNTYRTPGGAWRPYAGVYTDNTNLDHGDKGFITAGDMALALGDGACQHAATYAAIASELA